MSPIVRVSDCRLCGTAFEQERRRGRPRELCPSCGSDEATATRLAEKQRAYREANRDVIAEKKRAYRKAVSDGTRIVSSRWHCDECGEPLRRQTEDGLCGFCRQGIPVGKEQAA